MVKTEGKLFRFLRIDLSQRVFNEPAIPFEVQQMAVVNDSIIDICG